MKVVIFADGGSRGNPGVAGSGTVVYAADGITVLREIAYVVGTGSTNNVAEYHGLLRGLEAARDLGATDVEVHMDSKLVVEQISGRWKIKHPDMQKLALEAQSIIRGFDSFEIGWVPRAQNKVADALSNDAMDACAAGHPVGIVRTTDQPAEEPLTPAPGPDAAPAVTWLGDRGEITTFILLRHGQTEWSVDHKYAGRSDIALTETGIQQARAAADALRGRDIDAIVSSPLRRCLDTAAEAAEALGLHVETHDKLAEVDFGLWEGLDFDEARGRDPQFYDDWLHDPSLAPPGGESLQTLHRRVRAARADLVERYSGKTVLVVSHVGPIKSFLRQGLDAGPVTVNRIFLDTASLSVVEFWDGGSLVRSMNETGHLR
ncbi:bifunctional RNase H/acid phosphatase [uncultured Corynebacterium sp.]|uniref:bifunctional RNase H/acid phosphatase n=1 Tax=uncultured Corynebacterium sp. TaxID=159447 RepID=UPI0025D74B8D|nr:bifunctional RNase H/acid phosphatase [uncultured Corynebacterium sp.]